MPGLPLRNTNLQLVIAGFPTVAVDVDAGRVSTVNLPGRSLDILGPTVIQLGRAAALLGPIECATCGNGGHNRPVFSVRPGDLNATPLAQEAQEAARAGRDAAWLLHYERRGQCTIRRVAVDGAAGGARPSRCGRLEGQTPPGVIVNGSLLEDPASGRVLLRASGMVAASGAYVLRNPGYQRLALENIHTRKQHRLRWPRGYGFLQEATARAGGSQIALRFLNSLIVDRVSDVWVLDVATRRLRHVPGFPLDADYKHTSMTWTADGRLVVLTTIKRGDALIVWRPGARQPASGFLELPLIKGLYPSRSPGQYAMVAW